MAKISLGFYGYDNFKAIETLLKLNWEVGGHPWLVRLKLMPNNDVCYDRNDKREIDEKSVRGILFSQLCKGFFWLYNRQFNESTYSLRIIRKMKDRLLMQIRDFYTVNLGLIHMGMTFQEALFLIDICCGREDAFIRRHYDGGLIDKMIGSPLNDLIAAMIEIKQREYDDLKIEFINECSPSQMWNDTEKMKTCKQKWNEILTPREEELKRMRRGLLFV